MLTLQEAPSKLGGIDRRSSATPHRETDSESQARIVAFKQGLQALGWTDGRNIHIDYRFGLLIHTAPKDRSRAIDRYAGAARLPLETDEAPLPDEAVLATRLYTLGGCP